MNPWDFTISVRGDLPVFADCLEEVGHPGAKIVRALAVDGKFPTCITRPPAHPYACWAWDVSCSIAMSDNEPHKLPLWSLRGSGRTEFFSPTEAVWAVVNAGRYGYPWKRW